MNAKGSAEQVHNQAIVRRNFKIDSREKTSPCIEAEA